MTFRETPGWAGNSTTNCLESLSPASSSGCILASVQRLSFICHISLAAWGPSGWTHCQQRTAGLPWLGDMGTRSGRGRQGQVMGARGEELFAMPGGVFT